MVQKGFSAEQCSAPGQPVRVPLNTPGKRRAIAASLDTVLWALDLAALSTDSSISSTVLLESKLISTLLTFIMRPLANAQHPSCENKALELHRNSLGRLVTIYADLQRRN